MKDPQMPMWQRWAQFRLSVIGELLCCPLPKGQLQSIGQLTASAGETAQLQDNPSLYA